MKVILNNGTELNAISVNGSNRHFQGANRDSLEFVFKKGDYPFDSLDAYFADKNNTRKIILADETETQYIHDDYVLRVSMSMMPVVITPATSTELEVTEERISVVMSQQTYMEKMIEQLLGS